jgi:hypothetical protein
MEEDIKKQVFVGDTGNRAEVSVEHRDTQTVDAHYTKDLLKKAGKIGLPIGAKYLGSAVIHYYERAGISRAERTYLVACQTNVAKVEEHHADIGWKQLKSALMDAYGRPEPKVRN